MNTSVWIGPDCDRADIGEVIMYRNAMVILRDVTTNQAKVEMEDGSKQWVMRNELSLMQ